MHRSTGANSAHRAYSSGGSRTLIEQVDDGPLMQTMSGSFMKGETRKDVESPQNYGFTSVVHKADKGDDGQIDGSAEGFVSFMGGNRAFPVVTVMDDRRHRLKGLEEGDTAFYRGKDDRQQFHFTKDGNFMSARSDRKQRIALVPPPQDDQQQQDQGRGGGPSSGGSGGDSKQKKKATGQKSALDDNKKSEIYYDQSGSEAVSRHGPAHSSQRPSDSTGFMTDRKKSTQVTDEHAHIRFMDNRIFNDEQGNWATSPIQIKKDSYCKE